jgi:hypothetical protein
VLYQAEPLPDMRTRRELMMCALGGAFWVRES